MTHLRTLDSLDARGKRAVLRADLNVPFEGGRATDTTRIERIVPTLERLLEAGASIVVLSHFGRPEGKVVPALSLARVAPALAKAIGRPVRFVATDWRDEAAIEAAETMAPGDVVLMENTRFHPGESRNDPALAEKFAKLGDFFVNDAFSAAHRPHASNVGIARLLPSAAGLAMAGEIIALQSSLDNPEPPVVALVGGAKVSSKLSVLGAIVRKVDALVIGGGMANTFLAAQGRPVGKSLCEHDLACAAREILAAAKHNQCDLVLPEDVVVAGEFKTHAASRTVALDAVGADDIILDIGPGSLARLETLFSRSRTVLWNGPLGAFEIPPFDAGTNAAARAAARLTEAGLLKSIAGGGDTLAALANAGVADKFTYISTAGGAFLEWLEGKPLPGVTVLQD